MLFGSTQHLLAGIPLQDSGGPATGGPTSALIWTKYNLFNAFNLHQSVQSGTTPTS
jgi:hypothetical protein